MAGFRSTVSPPAVRRISPYDQWLVDPVTGSPIGLVNPQGNGEDGQFYPVPLTAAQIAAPTAAMLADTSVTYCLNVAPYTQYISNGSALVGPESVTYGGSFVVIPSGTAGTTVGNTTTPAPLVMYGSLTVQNTAGITVQSELDIRNFP